MGYERFSRPLAAPGFRETTSPKVSPAHGFQEQGGGFQTTAGGSTAGGLGFYTQTVSNGSTTNLLAFGVSVLASSSAATAYTLAALSAGIPKYLVCQKATTTNTLTVTLAAGQYFQQTSNSTSTGTRKLTMNSGADFAMLLPLSSVRIAVLSTAVTLGST